MKRDPIIVIGFDGAEHHLIERWSDEGYLPTIASLMKRGCWGRLNSTGDISSGSVWPTFLTGVSPATHGIFYGHRELKRNTYQIHKKYANQIKRKPFWYWLSKAGKRIAIFDIPYTHPLKGLNGIQIVAWGAFAPSWRISSWPPELIKNIVTRFGSHPLASWYEKRLETINEYENFYERLISGVEKRGLISAYLLDQEPWDFFLMAFSEAHWAGHLLWHVMDDKHPDHNPQIAKTFKHAIRDVYSAIDSAISKLIEVIPKATFFIFSLDGMGANYSGKHLLPDILKRMGMMGKPAQHKKQSRFLFVTFEKVNQLMPTRRWGPNSVRKVESLIPIKLIETAKMLLPQKFWDYWTSRILYAGNEWRWSKSFCVPNEFFGAIRINLKGREPNGLIERGIEYDTFCEELIEKLTSLVNVDSGGNAVSEVVRVDRVYQGENISELPDLIVKWVGDAPIRALYSPHVGTIRGESPDFRTGAHRPDGFLIAFGKEVCKGKISEGGNIMDIAPTILYLMGQSVSQDIEGKVLIDIVEEDF